MKDLKNNILAIFLLLLGNIFLVFLITYDASELSLNSTSIYNETSNLSKYRNFIIDIFLQIFGITTYIIPMLLIFWSFKIYKEKRITFIKFRLISLFYSLITFPAIIYINYDTYSSGILGLYLVSHISLFYQFNLILTLFAFLALLFAFNLSYKDFIKLIKLLSFMIIILYRLGKYLFIKTKIFILQYIASKKELEKKKKEKDSPRSILNNEYIEEEPLKVNDESFTPNYNLKEEDTSFENIIIKKENPEEILEEEKEEELLEKEAPYNIPFNFLSSKPSTSKKDSEKELKVNAKKIEQIIEEFGIKGKIVNIQTGPVVTLYEIIIPAGVKTSKVISLETDIALRMKAISVRISVIPGKDVIGIEIPNQKRQIVYLREILDSKIFQESTYNLPIVLGYDINGNPIIADLSTMPHLLIAGTTGSGKSVGVNAMILSLLYKFSPDMCKFIMIDPKMLELSVYQDIPHLLTPVVIDSKKAITILKWVVKEMEYRYYQMSLLEVRNILGFNEKVKNIDYIEKKQKELEKLKGINIKFEYLPYIVVIIDEMADLMLVAGKEVEIAVQRLAQMARAAGIHVIMATQRPSSDVITGTIKANFPTRISFQVSSKIDSRVVLQDQGAEKLLGKGDMLYMEGVGRLKRIHGPFISDSEVNSITNYLKKFSKPNYVESLEGNVENILSKEEEKDELLDSAIEIIKNEGKVSTSFLQRKLQIGYNRAASLVETLEAKGLISKPQGAGKREIYIK